MVMIVIIISFGSNGRFKAQLTPAQFQPFMFLVALWRDGGASSI